MPSNLLLDSGKVVGPRGVQDVGDAVVEAHHRRLELRHDHVFIVSRVADQGAFLRVALKVARPGVLGVSRKVAPEKEPDAIRGIKVRLVVGPSAVDVIEVEPWRAEIDKTLGVVLPLEAARGVEGQIVVDELSEVSVAGRDAEVLFIIILRLGRGLVLVLGHHGVGQFLEIVH